MWGITCPIFEEQILLLSCSDQLHCSERISKRGKRTLSCMEKRLTGMDMRRSEEVRSYDRRIVPGRSNQDYLDAPVPGKRQRGYPASLETLSLPLPLVPLSPLSYSSLPSTLPPSDYPASLRITAFPRYFLNLEA